MVSDHDQVIIREGSDPHQASLWILILSAASIPHTVKSEGAHFSLLVSHSDQLQAEYELYSYQEENRNWPPKRPQPDTFTPQFAPFSILLIGLLALFYLFTGPWHLQSAWFINGAGDSELILNKHQYYRIITALTLHADIVHLAGNCLIGLMLFHFLCRTCGNGFALFLTLIGAAAGNYINVLLHGNGHHFVGFSTAVFTIIGILTSLQMVNFKHRQSNYLQILTPLMAGLGLLAILGSSGERTDLGAHFFGLLSGIATGGLLHQAIYRFRTSMLLQTIAFLLATLLLVGSWQLAF